MPNNKIVITSPDDWHLHLRDNQLLPETITATSRCFKRAIVMPNLVPPITDRGMALDYKQRILESVPSNTDFNPLMTLFLNNSTTSEQIKDAYCDEIPAAKLYPAGATTNSETAVNDIEKLYPIFETMSEVGMKLLLHGEVTDIEVDIFDREKYFIDQYLIKIAERFPNLKIVFEHITTADAVDFVISSSSNLAATITPQHLMLNRNDLLVGGIRPHNYCLPILKRRHHQQKLRDVVASGSNKFFLGTDSAPHTRDTKESNCGCAGCYSAWSAIEMYTQVFDELGCLDKLEGFTSHYGADFYGYQRNDNTLTLIKERWQIPKLIKLENGNEIVPFLAGEILEWKVQESS